ncbi:BQ2448_7978 [Microbotryum intermedium]|uniref:Mediator of RNA polymerase II transcription subunit 5 n=1 Tax=Microbotryum intermedium TaxID=269621 RepID=A0A238FQ96_9BASI|nr:BQ2448_7978 [Microbotryum intermedium]
MVDSVHKDLGLVTRACWAKGVSPSSWQQLVAQTTASSLLPVEVEQQICGKLYLFGIFWNPDALLQLLADSGSTPSPLVVDYVESAVTPSTSVAQLAPSLVRVGFFAARLTRFSATSIALDRAFDVVNKVLSSTAPDVATHVMLNADELVASLDWALGMISRLGTAHSTPGELTLQSPTVTYISAFLQRPPIPFSSVGANPQLLDATLAKLDAVVSTLQRLPVDPTAAQISTGMQRRLLQIKFALSPNAEVTSKVLVVPRAHIASPRPMSSLDLAPITQADPDVAFLISDLVSKAVLNNTCMFSSFSSLDLETQSYRGHTSAGVANTPVATARIVALLKDRLAQADARGSTNEQALSRAFLEIFLAVTVDLRESVGKFTRQASFAYSRLLELLRDVAATRKVDVQGSSDLVRSALESSVRLFADSTRTENEHAMDLDGASTRPVLDALVAGLCQHELISTDLAASLSPSLHQSQLVPSSFPSTTAQLTSGSVDSVREVFASLESHGPASHRAISDSLVEAVSCLASNVDILGFSSICSVLVEQPSILWIVFLHVQPFLVLSPIRSLLDTFGSSLENLGYDDPSTGYGVVLLFIQVVISRHGLQTDLVHHLGSRRGFLVWWLPSISATYPLTSLDDDAKATINGWINALFGDGISDELMHQTNPRTLLKVLPTVAKQSLAACHAGVIDSEQLRDGLSFLLQSLLSFTLPGVLKWLVGEIERTPTGDYQTMMLDMLSVLIFSESLPKTIVELVASDLATLVHRLPSTKSTTIDVKRVQNLIQPYRRALTSNKNEATPHPSSDIAVPMDFSFDCTIYSSSLTSLLYTLLNSSPPTSTLTDGLRMTRLAKTILLVPSHSSDLADAHAGRFTSFVLQDLPSVSINHSNATKLGSWIGEALKAYQFVENELVNEGQSSGGVFDLLVSSVIKDVKRRRALKLGDGEAVEVWAQELVLRCRAVGEGLEKM